MIRASRSIGSRPPESLTATLSLAGYEFPFRLFHRPIRLGPRGTVDYYWMDNSQFRSLRTDAEASNFRSVVSFWTAAMQHERVHNDLDNRINYVLAITYGLVCRRKTLQNIVLDAYLMPDSSRRSSSAGLSRDICDRIQAVVSSRDRMQVQEELSGLLRQFSVPRQMLPLLQEALRRWVGRAIVLERQRGLEGLEHFLAEADYWMQKFRKRSDRWVRHFLDLFAYECKVAFHTCYANAWIGLIPWLRENRGLDELSERFMRFWHNQNQAVAIPHGQTAGGIIYPTRRGIVLTDNHGRSGRGRRTLNVETDRIGPAHIPDVFHGQVLSLHPMSAFFMKDAALCAIAGNFFASDEYEDAQVPRLIRRCPAYWDLVGAILTATHVYRQAVERQAHRRGARTRQGAEDLATHEADDLSIAGVFEDYAAGQRMNCSRCNGRLQFVRYAPPAAEDGPVEITFSCVGCRRRHRAEIAWNTFAPWLNGR